MVSTIKNILKDANLADMTMKNLCMRVYDKYPDCDLERTKKDFIRSTAKEVMFSFQSSRPMCSHFISLVID